MNQSKLSSFIETICNTVVGYVINYVANILVFPLFGLTISLKANLLMGLIYTVISVVRGFALRRYFNAHLQDAAKSLANWWISRKVWFNA